MGGDEGAPQARRGGGGAAPPRAVPAATRDRPPASSQAGQRICHLLAVDLAIGALARMPWGARSGEDVA